MGGGARTPSEESTAVISMWGPCLPHPPLCILGTEGEAFHTIDEGLRPSNSPSAMNPALQITYEVT